MAGGSESLALPNTIEESIARLVDYCRRHDWAGFDPYDALSSRLFARTPLSNSRIGRILFTQTVKRLPINVRSLLQVPEEQNPKAIALFLKRDGQIVASPALPLEDLVAEGDVTLEDLDLHLSSLFPFVRLRNYMEVRAFDAVEWPLARGVVALLSGILYCTVATGAAVELSNRLVVDDPERLEELHMDAARRGLDAVGPEGDTFRDLALELVEFASTRVGKPDCNWARVEDLESVREVLAG